MSEILCDRGDTFIIKARFEESACPIFLKYYDPDGKFAGKSAMRMGVHNSDDWESILLAEPYELCFKAAIVDGEDPNWATCQPLADQ